MASFNGDMGVSFQASNHLSGGCGDGTKIQHYYGGSPTAEGGINDETPLCLSREP